jgi:hypothetical protein
MTGPPLASIELFLTALVLAGVECLHRNLTNAIAHVDGALQFYSNGMGSDAAASNNHFTIPLSTQEQQVARMLALEVDIQTMQYTVHQRPKLHVLHDPTSFESVDSNELDREDWVISSIHASYTLASDIIAYKYRPRAEIPEDMIERQQRLLEQLAGCLSATTQSCCPPRCQSPCLSALVHLNSVSSPYETDFDKSINEFQRIVDISETVIPSEEGDDHMPPYKLTSSLHQPLFLTAMKCREPVIRRRAIDLLRKTGKSGPWDSEILVALAQKALEIEEREVVRDQTIEIGKAIPESARLRNHGLGYLSTDTGSPVDGLLLWPRGIRKIEALFTRCLDVDAYVQESVPQHKSKYWISWDEPIDIGITI